MTHPLTDTVGSIVTASLASHGRADYRRGEAYKPHASQAWREGWIAEAHLCAMIAQHPEALDRMSKLDALTALEAAERVLKHCTVSKPTRQQAAILAEAKPLIEQALARFVHVEEPAEAATDPG